MQQIALFDFDGTVTQKDTLVRFIRFAAGKYRMLWGMAYLSPMLTAYKLKLIQNYKAKEIMLSYFFKDMDESDFLRKAKRYSLEHIDTILRPGAMERIRWHQTQGHRVVIVSASIECWLKPWCDRHNIELIATRLERKDGKLTGKFLGKNCYGMEKALRIREAHDLENYKKIFAYGDSPGDREMLALAHEAHYRPFR
jgi:HAD superfamily hydrolase (TIGR01490 family)